MVEDGYDFHRMTNESKRFILSRDDDDPILTGSFGVTQEWIFRKRENPMSKLEEWEASKWRMFSNDERRIIESRKDSMLTMIELQKVTSSFSTVVKDLLCPEGKEYEIYDYSLASQFAPFQTLLAYLTPLENHARLEANAVIVSSEHVDDLMRFLAEKSGSEKFTEQKAWLRNHAPEVAGENSRLMNSRRDQFLKSVDTTQHIRVYRSGRTAAEWARYFELHPEFDIEEDIEADERKEAKFGPLRFLYVWLRRDGAEDAPRSSIARLRIDEDGSRVEALAFIYVHDDVVRIEGVGTALMDWIFDRWDGQIAQGLKVVSNSVDDLRKLGTESSGSNAQESQDPDLMKHFEESYFKDLFNQEIPALQNMSPLTASRSADPEVRQLLTRWAKTMILNHAKKQKTHGTVPNLFWFYDELRLAHLWPNDWPKA